MRFQFLLHQREERQFFAEISIDCTGMWIHAFHIIAKTFSVKIQTLFSKSIFSVLDFLNLIYKHIPYIYLCNEQHFKINFSIKN